MDVYGFGMLCYELFIGKLAFQGHPLPEYDLVLLGKRLDISNSSWESWMRRLLQHCWDEDPHQRPRWDEILQNLTKEYFELRHQHVKMPWLDNLMGNHRNGEDFLGLAYLIFDIDVNICAKTIWTWKSFW